MPIVGFNFTKLRAEKKADITPQTRAKSDLRITNLSQENLAIGVSDDVIKFTFDFDISYGDAGSALLSGNLLYMDEPKKVKEILSEWKKDSRIDAELMTNVLNNILFKSTVKALSLTQEVNLPPHFKLPHIKGPEKKKE